MPANYTDVEKRLWEAADELRANSKLKSSEYSVPVLGLIFLSYADQKFTQAERELAALQESSRRRRTIAVERLKRVVFQILLKYYFLITGVSLG